MGRRILFSPIGGTDPIKYSRDGSMLHICRHYQPDVVYLYLSHQMMEYHRQDDRYRDAIKRLGEHLGHDFKTELIEKENLRDVQEYDFFYKEFREEIQTIKNGMSAEDELYVNIASGTPAMKSALLVMAVLGAWKFTPIQVTTPKNGINKDYENREKYDPALEWEFDADNEKDAPNRCVEAECDSLSRMLRIEEIRKHIEAYDYAAALTVARDMKDDIPEDACRMLEIADARTKLDLKKISKLLREEEQDIYPVKEGDKQKIFEYALGLQRKIRKEEYCDFIRGITPLTVDLLEKILKKECKIKLSDCTYIDKKDDVRKWNIQNLKKLEIFEILDKEYSDDFRGGPVYSHHIEIIIASKSGDEGLKEQVKDIVRIEKGARHPAAHEMHSVTAEWIKERVGRTPDQIMAVIKSLIGRAGIHVKEDAWESYRAMNEKIEDYLKK